MTEHEDDDYFVATEEQFEAIKVRLCPVSCPHKDAEPIVDPSQLKRSARTQHFHGFTKGYWCNKYRSVLGSHALRPFSAIMGGDPLLVVMKSPFCPDNAKQESDHD